MRAIYLVEDTKAKVLDHVFELRVPAPERPIIETQVIKALGSDRAMEVADRILGSEHRWVRVGPHAWRADPDEEDAA